MWPHHSDGHYIQMPPRSRFTTLGGFYETLLHEMAHWCECQTEWDHRQHGYAMGELVAEMAACLVAGELGIPNGEGVANHAAYLKSWLDAMKADSGFIFKACSQASKVSDFLMSFAHREDNATVVTS
jgi:antirestriction protein ArdC